VGKTREKEQRQLAQNQETDREKGSLGKGMYQETEEQRRRGVFGKGGGKSRARIGVMRRGEKRNDRIPDCKRRGGFQDTRGSSKSGTCRGKKIGQDWSNREKHG